jgi:hypothetical protein
MSAQKHLEWSLHSGIEKKKKFNIHHTVPQIDFTVTNMSQGVIFARAKITP